ncbi:MAG TPA: glycine cleavage T C-terminal barrel domain-containing protein, partial [Methyloversatilis sp.]
VTSIAWSPHVGRHIGLAFVLPSMTEPGTPISIRVTDGAMVQAEICATPFFDPDDLRQKESS